MIRSISHERGARDSVSQNTLINMIRELTEHVKKLDHDHEAIETTVQQGGNSAQYQQELLKEVKILRTLSKYVRERVASAIEQRPPAIGSHRSSSTGNIPIIQ